MALAIPVVSAMLSMPIIGYGTWQSSGTDLAIGVEEALKAGYRHIDTAYLYQNEKIIGNILKKWMSQNKLKRKDLFITTKLPPTGMRPSAVSKYLDKSLKDLQLDYVDLYLVHMPFGFVDSSLIYPMNWDGSIRMDMNTDHAAIWKEMENQVKIGKAKAIGLSNFNITQIKNIMKNASIKPANVQVEMHLFHQQAQMRQFCNNNNITMTAYSPLGSKGSQNLLNFLGMVFGSQTKVPNLFNVPAVKKLAEKYGKTTGQILLRHLLHKQVAIIPKSTTPKHIKENIQLLDFELDQEDIALLDSLDKKRQGRILSFEFFRGAKKHPYYPF